jgi:hypothetical protein
MNPVQPVPEGPEPKTGEQRDLSVRVEVVAVDGPAAAAWKARQTAAIRALLEWMAEQPTHGEHNSEHRSDRTQDSQRRAA